MSDSLLLGRCALESPTRQATKCTNLNYLFDFDVCVVGTTVVNLLLCTGSTTVLVQCTTVGYSYIGSIPRSITTRVVPG